MARFGSGRQRSCRCSAAAATRAAGASGHQVSPLTCGEAARASPSSVAGVLPASFSPASLRVADFLHVPLFPGGLLRVGSCLLIVLLLPERQVRRFEEGVGWPAPLPSRA